VRQRRHTLSINGALYKRLAARCSELDVSVSGTVERLLAGDLAGVVVPASTDRGRKFVSDPPRVEKGRLAAQLAHDERLSFVEAARRTGVNRATIAVHWQRLYPNEPKAPGRPAGSPDERGEPQDTRAQHGTRSRYVIGCRCDTCRAANAAYETSRLRAKRNPVTCAYCVSRPSTHTDDEGYACCDRCESEPAIERRGIERGYEPSGGLLNRDESTAGCRRALGDERYERDASLDDDWGRQPHVAGRTP